MKLIAMTLASLSLLASSVAHADPTKARGDVSRVAPALEKYPASSILHRGCDEAKSGQIVISQRAFGAIERWVKKPRTFGQLRLKGI